MQSDTAYVDKQSVWTLTMSGCEIQAFREGDWKESIPLFGIFPTLYVNPWAANPTRACFPSVVIILLVCLRGLDPSQFITCWSFVSARCSDWPNFVYQFQDQILQISSTTWTVRYVTCIRAYELAYTHVPTQGIRSLRVRIVTWRTPVGLSICAYRSPSLDVGIRALFHSLNNLLGERLFCVPQ